MSCQSPKKSLTRHKCHVSIIAEQDINVMLVRM
nr:MAG TPA: hypothetical protein [Bacteriophage sp.]